MSHNKENARPLHNRLSLSIQRQSLQPRSHHHAPADPLKPAPAPQPANDFSRRLADAKTYRGADPLGHWFSLYQWTAAHQSASLQLLLETALDSLQSDPSYPTSPQYVGLWLAYARLCPDPLPFYTDMYTQGVGSSLTALYTDWADALERGGSFDEADGVYMKALLQQSQPLAELIQRYDAFKKRWTDRKATATLPSDSRKRPAGPDEQPKDVKQAKVTTGADAAPVPAGDRDIPGYDERLLTLDGVECQFEEHRIRRWRAAHPTPSAPAPQPIAPTQSLAPSQPARKASHRSPLEPVSLPSPFPALSPPAPSAASTPSRGREALAAFLQSGPAPTLPRSTASPTIHTRAAMDDVDAMFRDLTSTLPPSSSLPPSHPRPSAAFCTTSLTSELTSLTTPACPPQDSRARPSPVAFSIHEDTELIRPTSSLPIAVYEDTGLIVPVRAPAARVEVYEDGEDEVEIQSDETIARRGGQTPTSQGVGRGNPLVGLTPIMETSRESDASSLSNLSMRSTSSLSTSTTRPSTAAPAPVKAPVAPVPAPAPAETGPLNPLATSIQALILSDLNIAASAGVTSHAGPAPSELMALLTGAACEGVDVDVGDWWLRVEGRREGEDVVEGEGAERRVMRVFTVTEMNSAASYSLHLHQPASLWEHYACGVLAGRGVTAQTQLVTATHVYADISASLVPCPQHATLTLAALLAAYRRKGQTLPPLLVAFYLHSLLHGMVGLAEAQMLHCGLTPAVCWVATELLATEDWQPTLPTPWPVQGLTVGAWTSAVDLKVWEGEEGDWRAEDGRGAARVLWAMLGGEGRVEEVVAGKVQGGLKVGSQEAATVVRALWSAGGGEAGMRAMRAVKRDVEVWLQGEGGSRSRQIKKAICTQSILLSS